MSPIQGGLVELRVGMSVGSFPEQRLVIEPKKASARRNFQRSYESARSSLKTSLSPLDFNHVCSVIETKALKIKERNSRKLEKKFNNLNSKSVKFKQR